jgi:DNA polymerase-4
MLMDRITRRMRTAGRTGRTVVLRMRFDDYGRATRSHTLPRATASTEPLVAAARQLLSAATPLIAQRGLTMMGFSVANIDRCGAQQLELPFDSAPRSLAIDTAVDRVRHRYGIAAVTRAVLLNRDPGLEMPHLPD